MEINDSFMNVQITQEQQNNLVNLINIIKRAEERQDFFEMRAIEVKRILDETTARYKATYLQICKEKNIDPNQTHNFTVASTTPFVNNDGDPTQ